MQISTGLFIYRAMLTAGFLLVFRPATAQTRLSMEKIAELPDRMYETSGLVYYNSRYLITHNDGGNKSELFVLDVEGNHLKTIRVDADNEDWEEITCDTEGNLYIGDFGNNLNKRDNCHIYIVEKGFIDRQEVEPEKITFTYEDQEDFPPHEKYLNFDCEAFFWRNDSLYLFTKCRTKPFTGISNVYVLPAKKGKYKAKKIGSVQLCSLNWQFCSVTACAYSEKFNSLVLLTYSRIYLISGFRGSRFWEGKMTSWPINIPKQREAICFRSRNVWYITDEYRKGLGGGNLYRVKLR